MGGAGFGAVTTEAGAGAAHARRRACAMARLTDGCFGASTTPTGGLGAPSTNGPTASARLDSNCPLATLEVAGRALGPEL